MSLMPPPFTSAEDAEPRWIVKDIMGFEKNQAGQVLAKVSWEQSKVSSNDPFFTKEWVQKVKNIEPNIFCVEWKPTLEHPINLLHIDGVIADLKSHFECNPELKKYNALLMRKLYPLKKN